MLLEFVAAIAAAFAAAGVVMALNWLLGGRLPRVALPIAAGAAMLGYGVWSEYSWFDRTSGGLPDGMAVTFTHAEPSAFRPWTYVSPFVSRFSAIDAAGARTNPGAPGKVLADLYLFARYAPTAKAPILVDCDGRRRAEATGAQFNEAGGVASAEWRALEPTDPLLAALCAAPADPLDGSERDGSSAVDAAAAAPPSDREERA
ncbi:MAG: hypothetical protein AAF909_05510 [Pseudomonadota bacterium]